MCHWQESVRLGSIPSIWVFILQTPGAILCFVELHSVSGQHACLREHMSCSQELIVQEVLYFNKPDPLLKS